MSNDAYMLLIAAAFGLAALGGTAAVAYILVRLSKNRLLSIVIAGLGAPLLMLVMAMYSMMSDSPDGPPPGMVLMGVLVVAAIATPVTMLVSWLAVRFAQRPAIKA